MAELASAPPRPAAALESHGLTVAAGGFCLVDDATVSVRPGELVALIGPSGAGKTSLMRALAGIGSPYAGSVQLGGEPVRQRIEEIGYVPSHDLLHEQLTVEEELFFAASLRAAPGTSDRDLEERVAAVLDDLQMTPLANSRVSTLSKGQRRRTSVGVELVGRPSVLLLDEPGGGLDESLERRLMDILRRLADEGRGVLAGTHATANLRTCDRVIVMAPGGIVRFVGTADEMLEHFEIETFGDLYPLLNEEAERRPEPKLLSGHPTARREPPKRPSRDLGRQLRVLIARGGLCRMRDVRSLSILIGQAPILGFFMGVTVPHGVLNDDTLGPYYGVLLAFMLLVGAIWLGTIASCREIVGEQDIIYREAAVGVRLDAYVLARCVTLFPLVAVQTTLMALVVALVQPLPSGTGQIIVTCIVAGCASACIGLWLSAWSRTGDQATSTVPLILIPQMLFAGALVPVSRLPVPLQAVADITIGRWSLTGIGSALGLDGRLGSSLSGVTGLNGSFFAVSPGLPLLVMAGVSFIALCFAGSVMRSRVYER